MKLLNHIVIKDVFGVDAGNISVVDLDYIKYCGGYYGATAKRCCKLVKLKPGKYEVDVFIHECAIKRFILYTTGKVVIGDVCYLFSSGEPSDEKWMPFLKKTKYFEKQSEYTHFISTGGDGSFDTIIHFNKIGDETCMTKKKKNKNV
jgi:hypothetical protein